METNKVLKTIKQLENDKQIAKALIDEKDKQIGALEKAEKTLEKGNKGRSEGFQENVVPRGRGVQEQEDWTPSDGSQKDSRRASGSLPRKIANQYNAQQRF